MKKFLTLFTLLFALAAPSFAQVPERSRLIVPSSTSASWFRGATSTCAGSPTFSATGDTNSGINLRGSDVVDICSNGLVVFSVSPSAVTSSVPVQVTSALNSYFTGGGNVGIGTTGPNEQLEITGNFRMPATTATVGIVKVGANRFIYNYADSTSEGNNTFVGLNSGNFTMGPGGGAANLGSANSAFGALTLQANTTGYSNTGMGVNSLKANTTGFGNTGVGVDSLKVNTTGDSNNAFGLHSLNSNTTGQYNSAFGNDSLFTNTTGSFNTGVGHEALRSSTISNNNTALGLKSLYSNTVGGNNTAIGFQAGYNSGVALLQNNNSTFVGYGANTSVNDLTNVTAIGYLAQATASNQVVLGNTSVTQTLLNGNVGIGTTTPTANTLQLGDAGTFGWSDVSFSRGAADVFTTPDRFVSTGSVAGIGYGPGAGGAVTQLTSRTTGVTLNTVSGQITLVSAAGSATYASFTVTNSAVAATDEPYVWQVSGTDLYEIMITAVGAGSFRVTFRTTGGTTTETPVFGFVIRKAVIS